MRGWAAQWIMELQEGDDVQFRPKGRSMEPLIKNEQLVTCTPVVSPLMLKEGDIVLCMVAGAQYLHKILTIKLENGKLMFLIGNNKGGTNGWTQFHKIYGKVIKVED